MDRFISPPLFAAAWFIGILLFLEVGRRLGRRRDRANPEGSQDSGLGVLDGAVLSLFALLIAFTVSGAVSRFDARRQLIADEANAIGTAYLRLDLLPADAQPAMRGLFRQYLDSRLAVFRKLPDLEAAKAEISRSEEFQAAIWTQTVAAVRGMDSRLEASLLMFPALNDMFDITTTRTMASRIHQPTVIYALLFVVGLVSALLAGQGLAGGIRRNWLHYLGFAVTTVMAVYVILDIEYPRFGLVREDAYEQVLVELRTGMEP